VGKKKFQLQTAYFVVKLQAAMGLDEQLAHAGEVAAATGGNELSDAFIFADHVARAPPDRLRHVRTDLASIRESTSRRLRVSGWRRRIVSTAAAHSSVLCL
jgi:hypothetical protein